MPEMMTLPEYAKTMEKGAKRALVECFAASSDIMSVLPFAGMVGGTYEYHRQASLPTSMAFRGINEPGTSGNGTLEPLSESSFVLDHDLDVDRAIIDRKGMEARADYEKLGAAKAGRVWAQTFISGDNASNPREFNGIKKRVSMFGASTVANTRTLHNSASSGGAALSLANLDSLINMVNGCNALVMPRLMKPRIIAAARTPTVSGNIFQSWNEIGKPKLTYAEIPIYFGYEREIEGDLMNFDEVASGGGSAVTSSIYAAKIGETGVYGVQIRPLTIDDKGLLEDGITYRSHMSWDVGLVDEHPFCLARLTSITNAAFVA